MNVQRTAAFYSPMIKYLIWPDLHATQRGFKPWLGLDVEFMGLAGPLGCHGDSNSRGCFRNVPLVVSTAGVAYFAFCRYDTIGLRAACFLVCLTSRYLE